MDPHLLRLEYRRRCPSFVESSHAKDTSGSSFFGIRTTGYGQKIEMPGYGQILRKMVERGLMDK